MPVTERRGKRGAYVSYKLGFVGMMRTELESDRWGTLKKMAEMGYQGFEGDFLIGTTDAETMENRRRLNDLGLECISLQCSHYKEDQLSATISNAQRLGASYIVDGWAGPQSDDELQSLTEQLERMATHCQREGLRFLYHNHEHEFQPGFGKGQSECMFDLLYRGTEKLCFELDIAWCHFGGVDPVTLLRRCGRRIPALHVKDLADDQRRGHFSVVGIGKVNCFGAIEAAVTKGANWIIVEQDWPGLLSEYESAQASMFNIREAGLYPSLTGRI